MSFNFETKDQEIFRELYRDPFQSYNKISGKVNLAPATVKSRILKMKKHGFLRQDKELEDPVLGKRIQTEVMANYLPPSIGLIRIIVLFEGIPSLQTLQKLVRFCDEHPYTHYRGVVYKNPLSLFTHFDVPFAIENEIYAVISELKDVLEIKEAIISPTEVYSYAYPDYRLWNNFRQTWKIFDGSMDSKDFAMGKMWNEFIDGAGEKKSPEHQHKMDKRYSMSLTDAALLRELTINAKVSLKFLSSEYELTPSVLSRYLTRLKDNVIHRGNLLYDESFFGMNNLQINIGRFDPNSDLNVHSLCEFFSSVPLPFQSNIYANKNTFTIETMASPLISTEISRFLLQYTDPSFFNSNQVHIPSTALYHFYHKNYIARDTWNTDTEYIKDIPLATID